MSEYTNLKTRVLDYLKTNKGGLSVLECQHKIGTTELRKIVSDLKDAGNKIESVWEQGVNRFGEDTRFKRYFYLGKETK